MDVCCNQSTGTLVLENSVLTMQLKFVTSSVWAVDVKIHDMALEQF